MKAFWCIYVVFLASQLDGCRGDPDYVNVDDLVKNDVKAETTTPQTTKAEVAGSGDEQGESRSMYGGMSASGERCPSPNYRPTGSYSGNYQQQQGYPYQGPSMGNNNMGMGGGYPSYGMQGPGGMPPPGMGGGMQHPMGRRRRRRQVVHGKGDDAITVLDDFENDEKRHDFENNNTNQTSEGRSSYNRPAGSDIWIQPCNSHDDCAPRGMLCCPNKEGRLYCIAPDTSSGYYGHQGQYGGGGYGSPQYGGGGYPQQPPPGSYGNYPNSGAGYYPQQGGMGSPYQQRPPMAGPGGYGGPGMAGGQYPPMGGGGGGGYYPQQGMGGQYPPMGAGGGAMGPPMGGGYGQPGMGGMGGYPQQPGMGRR